MQPSAYSECTPELFSSLPNGLRWSGDMSEWARMTRPGRTIHSFLEGPVFDDEGMLWLSDVAFGRVFRIDRHGDWQLELEYDGEPHAAKPGPGGIFLITDYRRGLLAWRPGETAPAVVAAGYSGEPFRGLSDLTFDASGIAWFTDSGRSNLADATGRLFAVKLDGGRPGPPKLVLGGMPYPNGVAVDGADRSVYVAMTRANAVWRVTGADRVLGEDPVPPMAGVYLHLSGGLGPDGLALDPETGRLAIAQAQAGRAYVVDRLGDPLAIVRTPGRWTTSVAFAPDGSLFVVDAERGEIWRTKLPAPAPAELSQ